MKLVWVEAATDGLHQLQALLVPVNGESQVC